MKPRWVATGILLLLLAGGIARWPRHREPTNRADDDDPALDPSGRLTERRERVAPVDRLRSLPDTPLRHAPGFETVEAWAAKLSDGGLHELIEEAGMEDHTGLQGWLRCALFAEWGRRDPKAAHDYLNSLDWPGGNFNYSHSQAWFSLYRGWAEVDPETVRAKLEAASDASSSYPQLPGGPGFDEQARRQARTTLYRQLALLDPAGLQDIMNFAPGGPLDPVVMRGILSAGTRLDDLRPFVDGWSDKHLKTREARQALANHERAIRSSFTGFIPMPAEEAIARDIALTLAERDLDTALAWLDANDPGIESAQTNRVFNFYNDWARRHPQQALDRIAARADPDRAKVLAYGAFAGDFTLGPDIMRQFPKANDQYDIITTALTEGTNHHVDDFYPAPGKRNPLRDFAANYEAALATVAAAGLPPKREAELLRLIHKEFARTLPGAANAVEAPEPE